MTRVTVTDHFDQPVEQVWPIIADFGGIADLVPGIGSCRVEGTGIGQDRIMDLGGAVPVVERLTWFDADDHAFSYTILSGDMPFERYVATVRLRAEGTGTGVVWEGNFTPTIAEEKTVRLATNLYSGLIAAVKAKLAG